MGSFFSGVFVGFAAAAAIAAVGFVLSFRRYAKLQQRARETERLAELGTLTGGLAHEIKNPLSTLQLNLQLMAEDVTPDNPTYPRLASRLRTVTQETARLRETLDDFLRYAGRMEVDRKPTELNQLLEDLVDFFIPQAQLQKVQLRLKKSPQPVVASVDPKLIKQALLNLMLNGVQAMNQGGELMLSLAERDGFAEIEVVDTGPGIPPDAIERIFQAYYSTKRGGTGLGLAMTRRIVVENGGELSVKSEVGRGSAFTMRLPLASRSVAE
jgi:signal transduction histidine kinase